MSKLEKALNKAKSVRSLQLVRTDDESSQAATGRELVSNEKKLESKSLTIQDRIGSVLKIAEMGEDNLKTKQELSEQRIISTDMEDGGIRDAFRDIRTKILQISEGRNCVIMVTAPGQGSGTSFVSMNLAAAFSIDESKTSLLMDCNLHDPGLSIALEKYQEDGLTDYLESEDVNVKSIIHPIGVKRMRFIPAGERREIAGEYFTSIKMKKLIGDITERYPDRFLIIDSPPVLESADSHIMSELCDYIVMVLPYGKYTNLHLEKAINAIGKKKLIGIIINDDPGVSTSFLKKLSKEIFNKSFKKFFGK